MQSAAKEVDRAARLKKLYLWDEASKSVRLYANAQGACVANGVIRYTVRVDKAAGKVIVREGRFGSEKEIEKSLPSREERSPQGQTARVRSNFTCKTYLRSELLPPAPHGRRIVVLRDEDGYLDLGPEISFEPAPPEASVLLYRRGVSKPTSLPILLRERVSLPSYSSFIDAYLLYPKQDKTRPDSSSASWPKDRPQLIYMLYPDGRVVTTVVPAGEWRDVHHPSPTKAGLIFAGGNFYRNLALWLAEANIVRRLIPGYVYAIAVSPDGCRAAVGIQTKHLEMGTPIHLKVLEFCKVEG